MNAFSDYPFDERIRRAIDDLGFTKPTPIQSQTIEPIAEGRDVIGIAQTGTGKTAAFVLPMLHRHVQRDPDAENEGPRILILSPTRELAAQVEDSIRELAAHVDFRVALLLGGVPYGKQLQALKDRPDAIVATPGRLIDHLQQKNTHLRGLEVFILDEADRMLDMGFMPAIHQIISFLGKGKRQTLMFSATFPDPIARLAARLLNDPVRVDVSPPVRTPEKIRQGAFYIEKVRKPKLIRELLSLPNMTSVMVFCGMKVEADFIYDVLASDGFKVGVLHSDRGQKERTRALESFRNGEYPILIATDIAARGLDIKDVSHVINYDLPNNFEDYVHRVGRTARAEADGEALSFVTPGDLLTFQKIEAELGRPIERFDFEGVTMPWTGSAPAASPAASPAAGGGRRGRR